MVLKMQPKSSSLAVVAREVAMDIASSLYQPDITQHVPGLGNMAADYLSRPKKMESLPVPQFLSDAQMVVPPTRGVEWWQVDSV